MNQVHLPALDALRGFAVLVVFVSHAANDGLLPAWLGDGFGQMGVQLFFVLSGYLMMRLYGEAAFTAAAVRRFAVGRAARIVPLYALVLVVSLLLAQAGWPVHYSFDSTAQTLRAALFVTAPHELWSIPVEVQFYAVFVLLWSALPMLGARAIWLLPASLILAFVWRGWVSDAPVLIPYLSAFVLGLAVRRFEGWLAPVIQIMGQPVVALLCLAVFVLNMPGLRGAAGLELTDSFFARMWLDPVRLVALTALFLTALSPHRNFWSWPGGLHKLGVLSFCVYLIHRPILKLAAGGDVLPGPVLAALCLAAAMLVAAASMRWFERPAQRALKARLGAPKRPAPQPVPG